MDPFTPSTVLVSVSESEVVRAWEGGLGGCEV